MKIIALCDTCARQHTIDFNPLIGAGAEYSDWLTKHPGHATRFEWPQRSRKAKRQRREIPWTDYLHNADVKTAYGASTQATLTLASLAASSTLLGGRESTAIDNGASVKYLDVLLSGRYRTGAANLQAGTIRTMIIPALDDTPTWPDVFDGTDSAETISDGDIANAHVRGIISDITTDATQRTWEYPLTAIAQLFNGWMPDQFVIFVSHNAHTTTNVWSATESDHRVYYTGVYATVT